MEDTKIVPLERKHLAQVEKWPSQHLAANTLLKKPAISDGNQPDSYGWAVVSNEEVLVVATVRLSKEHVGYLNCLVNPAHNNRGMGKMLIEYVMKQPQIESLVHLHATIEADNVTTRQILDEAGFTQIGQDPNGYLEFARHMHY